MRAVAIRDRFGAVAKRSDANGDDNAAGFVRHTDVVARLIKRLRQFSDLRPGGAGVRQRNRALHRNDRAVLQHFEIVDTHTYPSSADRARSPKMTTCSDHHSVASHAVRKLYETKI